MAPRLYTTRQIHAAVRLSKLVQGVVADTTTFQLGAPGIFEALQKARDHFEKIVLESGNIHLLLNGDARDEALERKVAELDIVRRD